MNSAVELKSQSQPQRTAVRLAPIVLFGHMTQIGGANAPDTWYMSFSGAHT